MYKRQIKQQTRCFLSKKIMSATTNRRSTARLLPNRIASALFVAVLFHSRILLEGIGCCEAVQTEEISVNRNDWFYSLQECDGNDENGAEDPSPLSCWTVPSTYRISSATQTQSPYEARRSGVKLSAAANEFEGFQVRVMEHIFPITFHLSH